MADVLGDAGIDIGVEPTAEVGLEPTAEVGLEPTLEAEGPLGSKISLTADDVPELTDMQVGDTITLTIDDVTEDGAYSMSVAPAAPETPPAPEEAPLGEEPALGGQEAVLSELTG